MENEKSKKNVSIRSEHGREFQNTSFEEFCDEHDISHNFSAPRTPEKTVQLKERIGP